MKAFWWFKENSIAGMGRPGFNRINWSQLTFEEDLVLGWFGNKNSGSDSLESMRQHFLSHGTKLLGVHNVGQEKFNQILEDVKNNLKIEQLVQKVSEKTNCLEKFVIKNNHIEFEDLAPGVVEA